MPAQTPPARPGRIVHLWTLATIVCVAVLVIARAQQPVAAHADLKTDAARLDTALAETWKTIDPTTQPAKAQAAFERVRIEAERLGLKRQLAEALRGLASVESGQERNDKARTLLEQALPLYQQSGDALGEARAVRQLAVVLGIRQHSEEAAALLLRARDAFARLGARDDLALTYYNIVYASAASTRGSVMDEALAAARAGSQRWIECAIKHSVGDGQFNQGEYTEAYRMLTDALTCYEQTDKRAEKGRVLVSLGRIQRVHGQYERALAFYEKAYALQQELHDEAAAIQSLNASAVALSLMGRTEEARARYEEALARARKLGSERYITFLTGNLGGWYLGAGRYEEALPLLRQALATEKTDANRQYRYWQIAESLFGLGRLDDALASIDEAIKLAQGNPERLMRVLAIRAGIEQRMNRLDASESDMREALSLVEELRRKTLAQDFMKRGFGESTQEVFAVAIGVRAQRGDARGALEIAEQARARAFLDLLASRRSQPAVEGMLASTGTDAAVAPYLTAQQALAVASPRNVDAPNVNEMIATARRLRSTILAYWVGEHETLAWVIQPAGQVFSTTIKVDATQLADLARSTTALLRNGGAAGLAMFGGASQTKPWRDLYRILVQPVREHLPTTPGSLLTVVPHGPLFQVSFAALQDDQGKYLIESYRLHYTPSIGVLAYMAPSRQPLLRGPANALLVGDPMPPATEPGDEALAQLPWARREVTEIGAILGARRARVVTGADATETKVRAEIERADVLHFATHGVIRQGESMSSFLALTRSEGEAPPAGPYARKPESSADGKLTADEVYGLRLHADLVVLSACGTALGPMTGDGVIGFTRAFLYAGARSVIATEWNVPDETGYELMKRFYRFRRMGSDTSEALRNAQLSLLAALRKGTVLVGAGDNQVALRENPLFWAGFILVGER